MRRTSYAITCGQIASAVTYMHLSFAVIAAAQGSGAGRDVGLNFRIQASHSTVRRGEAIPIRVTIVNQSSQTQLIPALSPVALVALHVYNQDGKEIQPTPPELDMIVMRPPRTVDPGGELTLRTRKGEWLDLADWGYHLDTAGDYTVVAGPRLTKEPANTPSAQTTPSSGVRFTISQ